MEEIKEINDTALIAEVLGAMVQEKSEILWVVPFSKEIQKQVCEELFNRFFIAEN